MLSCFRYCLIIIIALVFTRANVFAQNSRQQVVGESYIFKNMLHHGIDSVLKTKGLGIGFAKVIFDRTDDVFQSYFLKLSVDPIVTLFLKPVASNCYQIAEGYQKYEPDYKQLFEYSLIASGKLVFKDSLKQSEFFFLSAKENIHRWTDNRDFYGADDYAPSESSFWDATVVQITLGVIGIAAAVALFFLIKG